MQFCQVMTVDGSPTSWLVVAPSRFASVEGLALAKFANRYDAQSYARKTNALARAYRGGRARDAKEKA